MNASSLDLDLVARLLVSVARDISRAHTPEQVSLPSAPSTPGAFAADWLVLSATDRAILAALLDRGPMKRTAVAKAIGRSEEGIREVLATLTARRVLVISPSGYTINTPSAHHDELREWLASSSDAAPGSPRSERGASAETSRPPSPLDVWPALSPTTAAVLRLLCRETRWVTASVIAAETRLQLERVVSPILRELVERGVVESRPGNNGGYMLATPEDRDPDEFRAELSDWLDRQGDVVPSRREQHVPTPRVVDPTPEEIAERAAAVRAERNGTHS